MKSILSLWSIILIFVACQTLATAPCFASSTFQPKTNDIRIHAWEHSPYISSQLPHKGLHAELIQAAFNAMQTTIQLIILPVKSHVKDALNNDNALAVVAYDWQSTDNRSNELQIPFVLLMGKLFYAPERHSEIKNIYRIDHLPALPCMILKSDNISFYQNTPLDITPCDQQTLIKHLSTSFSGLVSIEWLLGKHLLLQRQTKPPIDISRITIWETSVPLIFNKKHKYGAKHAKTFKQGLSKIIQNGTYLKMLQKYLGRINHPDELITLLKRHQLKSEIYNQWNPMKLF